MTRSECLGFGAALLLHAAALAWIPLSTSGIRPADSGTPVIQVALIRTSAVISSDETPAPPHRHATAVPARAQHLMERPATVPKPPAPVEAARPVAATSSFSEPPTDSQALETASAPNPGKAIDPVPQTMAIPRGPSEPKLTARPDHAHNPPAEYPALARRYGLTGRVMMRVLVEANGEAREVMIAASSGHDLLDQAALRSVRGWRFLPAKNGTETVAAWVEFPVRFELTN